MWIPSSGHLHCLIPNNLQIKFLIFFIMRYVTGPADAVGLLLYTSVILVAKCKSSFVTLVIVLY